MALNGVLPAVEQATRLGIADPRRLFVEGVSRGGWTVLSLLGQTTRFTAAVAVAYGEGARRGNLDYTVFQRYEDNSMEAVTPNGSLLKGYWPSDLPWWRDGDLLRRNHPLTYADRVQTPLLMLHGDLDPQAPFDEAEIYFYALVAMRKPAHFARYWGEGHGNRTPANVCDAIVRKLAWYDRWGDLLRDEQGQLVFDGNIVKSRNGAPPLTVDEFGRLHFGRCPNLTSTAGASSAWRK
jgi:dipeptidyl aminopeptidase/acylaminoacyl peptidase